MASAAAGRAAQAAGPSLAIALLHGEGDQASLSPSDNRKTSFGRSTAADDFFRGFATSSSPCLVVAPHSGPGGSVERILELLFLYLPLASVSQIFLGSLHTNALASYLESLPAELRGKITLLQTVTVAPKVKQLVKDGFFSSSDAISSLFGELGDIELGFDYLGLTDTPEDKRTEEDSPNVSAFFCFLNRSRSAHHGSPRDLKVSPTVAASHDTHNAGKTVASHAAPQLEQKPPPTTTAAVPTRRPAIPQAPPSASAPVGTPGWASYRAQQIREGTSTVSPAAPTPAPEAATSVVVTKSTGGAKVDPNLYGPPPRIPEGPFNPPKFVFPPGVRSPCNVFFLAPQGCRRKENCPFDHGFKFTQEQWPQYAFFVKSKICEEEARGYCLRGRDCIKGHRCPYTRATCPFDLNCRYLEAGLPHSV
ncbi:hypothetical protein JCM6882_005436 [Rhodosporidiobolus microsporus]